jgi:hypothetical protein
MVRKRILFACIMGFISTINLLKPEILQCILSEFSTKPFQLRFTCAPTALQVRIKSYINSNQFRLRLDCALSQRIFKLILPGLSNKYKRRDDCFLYPVFTLLKITANPAIKRLCITFDRYIEKNISF